MNIIEMYDKYRKQHAAEFKGLLEEVANEVVNVTEQIPEDMVLEIIRTNSDRHSVYCDEETPGKNLNFQYVTINGIKFKTTAREARTLRKLTNK